MPETPSHSPGSPLRHVREPIALVRLGVAGMVGGYVLTYQALPRHPEPAGADVMGALCVALLVALSMVQLAGRSREVPRVDATIALADLAIAVALMWTFSFDPRHYLSVLIPLAGAEVSAIAGMLVGITAWTVASAIYVVSDVRMYHVVPLSAPGVALRLTVGLLVVLVSGSLAERGRTRRALEDSERRNRTILETAGDAFIGIDLHGRITDWNRRAEEAFGWRRDEVLGMPLADTIIPARMRQAHAEGLRRYRETGEGTLLRRPVEMRAMHRNGREFPVEISVWSITEQGHPGFIAFVRDISERKQHEDQIAYLAYHDRLTGLGNRAMLEEHLEKALARSRRHARAVAVLCVDLDNLRLVNDGLGNEAGDELLRQAGERLQEAARETDLVTRQGGDEFLILLADLFPGPGDSSRAAARTAESVVERIHAAFRAPFRLAGTELYMSASIGVSLFPLDAADARTLLANASAAMHRSKQAGPGGHAMYAGGSADPVGKLSLSTRLRRAVEQEQWSLQFQPIVELDTNTVVAAEALLRWDEPGREPTPPSRFIALAEELGLIEAIGDWVLHALCRQAREWGDDGLDLAVTFNLSPRQLWKAGVAERIMSAVRAEGADPGQIVVEITESAAMTDPARTQVALQSLRDRGLRLAIDDFGTGYSSLSRLKHLAVDLLKIDLSFMADIPHDEGAARLMTAIIHLAKSLDVVPLAEGIQTSDQWEFLVERGCVLGQGFQFGPAVPAAELAARCRRSSIRVVHEHSAS